MSLSNLTPSGAGPASAGPAAPAGEPPTVTLARSRNGGRHLVIALRVDQPGEDLVAWLRLLAGPREVRS